MDIQRYSDFLKLFINNYHLVYPTLINNNLQIEIWNNKKVRLNLIGRYILIFLELPIIKDLIYITINLYVQL